MADISEIVQVTIVANTLGVTQRGFGTMLILGVNRAFPERIRYYRNLVGVARDFSANSPEYQAAALAFGQDIRPDRIAIGRVLSSNAVSVNVGTVVNNYNYRVTINGQNAVFNSGATASATSVATGLATELNALIDPVTQNQLVNAVADGAGNVNITPFVAGVDYGINLSNNLTMPQAVPSETWRQALDEISSESDDWYALVALTRLTQTQILTFNTDFIAGTTAQVSVNGQTTAAVPFNTDQATTISDLVNAIQALPTVSNVTVVPGSNNQALSITGINGQPTTVVFTATGTGAPTSTLAPAVDPSLDIAAWVQGNRKLYVVGTADAGTLTDPGTGIAADLAALGYSRTVVLYSAQANLIYVEAAWLGRMTPTQPGAANWAFKNLKGVRVDDLSTTESENARLINNANTYEMIGGIGVTRDGITSSRQYIDIIVGIDWLETRIQERIFQRIASVDKIPFTDAGIGIIEAELRAQLDEAVSVGLINDDYQVEVPRAADVTIQNKAARLLPDVFFTATLTNAINKVIIQGTVSY